MTTRGENIRMAKRLFALFLFLCLGAGYLALAQSQRVIVIRCGRLIDGRSAQPLLNATIVIRDERIAEVGQNLPVPPGAQVIDLSRASVLPGLIDLHAHILHQPSLGGLENYLNRSSARKALDGVLNAQKMLRAGFTTLRDPGDCDAYWIKLYVTGGVMSAGDDPRFQAFTDEEIRAAVDETHRYGKKITVHAIGAGGIKAAVRAGVDSVEHGILIDDEGIALMRERGVYLIPTLYVLSYIVEEGPRLGIPEQMIAKGRAVIASRDKNLRKAFAAGIKIAFGSDTIFPHDQAARELAHLVRLGLTPQQAIRAATGAAAELLGLDQEIGAIEAGKRADIIAVSDNPLENIRALEQVEFVMKDGRVVKNEWRLKQQ